MQGPIRDLEIHFNIGNLLLSHPLGVGFSTGLTAQGSEAGKVLLSMNLIKTKAKLIWKHEVRQADQIARSLTEKRKVKFGWAILFLPNLLVETVRFRKGVSFLRKNLLFTKKKAFTAARSISIGRDRSLQMGTMELETRDLLDREKKGLYTEKVRRKQIREMELLVDHYLLLLNSKGGDYADMLKAAYPSRKHYRSFLSRLDETEKEVFQASITSLRKGSKKERVTWFQRVREVTAKARMEEAERIFGE